MPRETDVEKEKPEVRIATVADAAEIARVQHASWLDTYPNDAAGISREDFEKYLRGLSDQTVRWEKSLHDEKTNHNIRTFVLCDGAKIIGYCRVGKATDFGMVDGLYLDPAYIGKGKGGEIFRRGLGWLDADKPIQLKVASYNSRAIQFYQRFGFRSQGPVRPLYISVNKMIPVTLMVRDVVEE